MWTPGSFLVKRSSSRRVTVHFRRDAKCQDDFVSLIGVHFVVELLLLPFIVVVFFLSIFTWLSCTTKVYGMFPLTAKGKIKLRNCMF